VAAQASWQLSCTHGMLIPWEDQLGIGKALPNPDIPSELVTRTRVHTRAVASNFAQPYPLFSRTRIKRNISSSLLETVEHKHVTARQNFGPKVISRSS
jgi:hypothetical protein